MVRERVKNRIFHDQYVVPRPPKEAPSAPLPAFFTDDHPLEVDIGCGRGRFLLSRAQAFPDHNFLGIDLSLLRLRKIDRKAVARNITNIRLLHDDAESVLPGLAGLNISTFYVFFPDPWPKRRHHCRRLISPTFVAHIHTALAPGGTIHLCTDHLDYFAAMTRLWDPDIRFERIPPFIPSEDQETDFGLLFRTQNLVANRCSYLKLPAKAVDEPSPLH